MKRAKLGLGLLFVLVVSSACGNGENRSYDYTENDCGTGKHEFDSQEAYCSGLKNRELNHGCAFSMRKAAYNAGCSGDFIET